MKRRDFLTLSAAATCLPFLAHAGTNTLAYTPGLVKKQLAAGNTVLVDFYTDWCTTCKSQQRTIATLRGENADYNENIVFVEVDWDVHSRSKLAKELKIPRRSTLVMLRGTDELGRIVAGTRRADIKALLDSGLASS